MKKKYIILFSSLIILIFYSFICSGQAGSVSAGGDVHTENYRVSFSVGQVFYTSIIQNNEYISLGLQHPTINKISNTQIEEQFQPDFLIFPNPSHDKIHIYHQDLTKFRYRIKLCTLSGNVIIEQNISNEVKEISLKEVMPGVYILLIFEDEHLLGSFNIIKI